MVDFCLWNFSLAFEFEQIYGISYIDITLKEIIDIDIYID